MLTGLMMRHLNYLPDDELSKSLNMPFTDQISYTPCCSIALRSWQLGTGSLSSCGPLIESLKEAREDFDNDPSLKFEDGVMMEEFQTRLENGEYNGEDEEFRTALVMSCGVMRVVTLAF